MEKGKNEENKKLAETDTLLQKRERERVLLSRKRQIVNDYIKLFRAILHKLIDLSGTTTITMVWSQTLNRAGDKHHFLKKATIDLIIDGKYPILKKVEESFPGYKSIHPEPKETIDLDVEKLYLEAEKVEEVYLREAFEETLEIFYTIGKILFGSTIKFPLVLDEEDI